jgi:hypothetical protein
MGESIDRLNMRPQAIMGDRRRRRTIDKGHLHPEFTTARIGRSQPAVAIADEGAQCYPAVSSI